MVPFLPKTRTHLVDLRRGNPVPLCVWGAHHHVCNFALLVHAASYWVRYVIRVSRRTQVLDLSLTGRLPNSSGKEISRVRR